MLVSHVQGHDGIASLVIGSWSAWRGSLVCSESEATVGPACCGSYACHVSVRYQKAAERAGSTQAKKAWTGALGAPLSSALALGRALLLEGATPSTALRKFCRGRLNVWRHPNLVVGNHLARLGIGHAADQSQEPKCERILRLKAQPHGVKGHSKPRQHSESPICRGPAANLAKGLKFRPFECDRRRCGDFSLRWTNLLLMPTSCCGAICSS
jgi:hypothetical protein